MGRFTHEALTVDPLTGIVYLTEDFSFRAGDPTRPGSGLYRYIPTVPGNMLAGGKLQMLALRDRPRYDTTIGQKAGRPLPAVWVDIDDPDPPAAEADPSAVFRQGLAQGGTIFQRLEGCCLIVCEDGGGEQWLRGLTQRGEIFDLATNIANGDEFAGACFSPDGNILFVNIQGSTSSTGASKGMTFAIWGPWEEGAL